MTTKEVGDTLTIEHIPNVRGLRIQDHRTHDAIFVPLARTLSSALLDAAADLAGELVGDGSSDIEGSNANG